MTSVLCSCGGLPSNAPIDDRTSARNAESRNKQKQAPAEEPAVADKSGFYTVKKGDTLLRISQQFNQSWRDLSDWNSLNNANDIKVGQVLRLTPPEGAVVSSVQIDPAIEVRSLALPGAVAVVVPSTPSAPAVSPQPAVNAKSEPLGNKIIYSEKAMSELGRPELAIPVRALDLPPKPAGSASANGVRFSWPAEGKIISAFDQTRKGIDIAGEAGQAIVAAGEGTVLYAKNMRGYGNLIIVDHSDGLVSAYAHNKTILVKEGQNVAKGQRIAEMGNSDSDIVKLHFEIRQLGKPVDPVGLLPGR
ncbi:MAG: Lipoprotein NlpD [Pseudomonadota bacterium]